MRAAILKEFAGPQSLSLGEIPIPSVHPGSVLVRAVAASANPLDIRVSHGGTFSPTLPAIFGCEVAGVVEAVGAGVTGFAPGDEVFGCVGGVRGSGGSLAEFVLADARLLALKPRLLSMREAATLPLVAITAFDGIDRAAVSSAHYVLIHGGAGGVGHIALQIALARGATVSTTVSARSHAVARRMGATNIIDYRTESMEAYTRGLTQGAGFDIVFDTIGGTHLDQSFQAARNSGQVISTIGLTQIDLSTMHWKALSLHVIFMLLPLLTGEGRERHGAILRAVAALADEGKLTPLIDESNFVLENAGEAYRRLNSGETTSKIVIDITGTAS
jgi:NADPH2:quinone reductase